MGGKRSHHYAIPCSPTCSKRKSLMGIKRMRCCAMSTVTLFFRAIWASCKLCFSWWNKMAAGSYRYPYTAVPGSPQHLTFCLVVTGLQSVVHLLVSQQGCALRKIEESPVLWTCGIQGAQHMISIKKVSFSGCLRGKACCWKTALLSSPSHPS